MLSPSNVQSSDCRKIVTDILYDESDNSQNEAITELTKDSFLLSTDYRTVYKNFDYKTKYDTCIYEGNDEDKIVGYKYLQSYPYDTPKFKIGDYVHWNYNHRELSTWIITSLDIQYLYNVKGKILQCNNSLRWKDSNGSINCYPCVIKDAMTYTNFKWGNKGVVEPGGDIVVIVQKNNYTSNIKVNDRFLFDKVGFRTKQIFNELNPNYMEIYMMKAPELSGDNLEENIAINNNPTPEEKDLNGIVVLPDINEIKLDKTIEFNVYNYINGVKQSDTFNVSTSGVPQKYFSLNIVDGNNFSVNNLNEYQINPINIECKDIVNGNKISKQIWLGGSW